MTSCIYGFVKNKKYKVSYNNSESYPSGFGRLFVSFIRENTLDELIELEKKLYLVPRKARPTKDEIEFIRKNGLYFNQVDSWEELSFLFEGFIEYYKYGVYFIPDFIEWKDYQNFEYIINLDMYTFDIKKRDKIVTSYPLEKIPRDWDFGID